MPIMSHEDSIKVIDGVNNVIKNSGIDTNKISDWYHTFGELYEHRISIYIALCRLLDDVGGADVWMSKKHGDGSSYEGWFILGVGYEYGKQISYHLPIKYWDECDVFAIELPNAPAFDGHTSNDVLERLKSL